MNITAFRKELKKKNMGAALLFNLSYGSKDMNLKYFSGFECESAMLAILGSGKEELFVPNMEVNRAKREGDVKKVLPIKKEFQDMIPSYVKRVNCVGLNKNVVPVNFFSRLKRETNNTFTDISGICSDMRTVKGEEEISRIKKACKVTDKVMAELLDMLSKKKMNTEGEMLGVLNTLVNSSGHVCSFSPIVASGKNSADPHHNTSGGIIRKGFCFIDFGLWHKGYTSDITRTIYFGRPSKNEKGIYEKLLSVQRDAVSAVREGMMAQQVDNDIRKNLGKLQKYFIHGTGHGIGVEVHERPFINSRSVEVLRKGNVFTIEPGLYYKDRFGIRIEDDVLISGKAKVLTKAPKELVCFPI